MLGYIIYTPDSLYEERTHAQVVAAAAEAERTKSCVLDVYGTSPLAHALDLVASVPIDYMHVCSSGGCYTLADESMVWFQVSLITVLH